MDYSLALVLFAGISLIAALTVPRRFEARWRVAEMRLAAIERNLKLVMDHLGVVVPDPEHPRVVAELRAGRKITAIKEYRDATGAGLAEAKAAVEHLQAQLGLGKGH
jgi:ribosomal protein L7/L12